MKVQADKNRSDRQFMLGDWVWLKLQKYMQISVASRSNEKLSPKYYGPFQITDTVGKVAYKLKLPARALIHNVFHVSQLKKFRGTLPVVSYIPEWFHGKEGDADVQPLAILDRRVVKRRESLCVVRYLVQWTGYPASEATWEWAEAFEQKFPTFVVQT
ncbi:uncharacterized protein LOC141638427 [Silene latifolia]|uniref:uncharacterized protein LOC141638427 n=1 Tax=Silene latifolia TaxID=37657 RepID=UPI003D7810CA